MEDPSIVSRFVAYVRHNFSRMLVDLIFLTSWILLGTEALRLVAFPRWAQYVVLFIGVVVYVQVTPQWHHPAREDD